MVCPHISATGEQIITKFSTVVGNHGNQIRHTTNAIHMGEGRASKKILYVLFYLTLYIMLATCYFVP